MQFSLMTFRAAGGCAVLAASLALSACADTPASTASTTAESQSMHARSPLAAPPSSMMTPSGY